MAANHSFDIVSEIDFQEVDNAVNQAIKEITQRFDLKDSKTEIELNKKDKFLTIDTKDDYARKQALIFFNPNSSKEEFRLKLLIIRNLKLQQEED